MIVINGRKRSEKVPQSQRPFVKVLLVDRFIQNGFADAFVVRWCWLRGKHDAKVRNEILVNKLHPRTKRRDCTLDEPGVIESQIGQVVDVEPFGIGRIRTGAGSLQLRRYKCETGDGNDATPGIPARSAEIGEVMDVADLDICFFRQFAARS